MKVLGIVVFSSQEFRCTYKDLLLCDDDGRLKLSRRGLVALIPSFSSMTVLKFSRLARVSPRSIIGGMGLKERLPRDMEEFDCIQEMSQHNLNPLYLKVYMLQMGSISFYNRALSIQCVW